VVTVPELLDGHTVLDVECLDRIYLNGYEKTTRCTPFMPRRSANEGD
jgi:hypothetical protein